MKHNNIIANIGQKLAVIYLKTNNYQIIAENHRFKHCEIDVIALKNNIFYLIEVKTVVQGAIKPEEQLSRHKRASMAKARILFAYEKNINQDNIFIEFIGVILNNDKKLANIRHFSIF